MWLYTDNSSISCMLFGNVVLKNSEGKTDRKRETHNMFWNQPRKWAIIVPKCSSVESICEYIKSAFGRKGSNLGMKNVSELY